MTVAQRTFEKIENLEKKLWAVSPLWLLSGTVTLIIGTASVVWAAVRYDNNKNADIASVSAKVDRLKQSMDNRHFRDSIIAENRYNYMLGILSPQSPVKKDRVKGYTAVKNGKTITYLALY